MPSQQLAPTRSNLIEIRETLAMAREGHDILEQKRDVLVSELTQRAHEAIAAQNDLNESFTSAYRALVDARLSMGLERLEWTALAVNESVEVDIQPYSVMGVVLPKVTAHGDPPDMPYGPGDTTVALDEAERHFRAVLEKVPHYVELVTSVWRLVNELKKTQRRVNALEYIFIPQYAETVDFIANALEEREREETFRLKRLKAKK